MAGGGDFYSVLGLEPRATAGQVERAYRFCLELYAEGSLATYSLLEPTEADAQRVRVQEAYAVLADPQRRRSYDESRGFLPPTETVVPFPSPAAKRVPLTPPSEITGPILRRIREEQGVTLRHVADVSKIGMRTLQDIEEDRFSALPAAVYLRGFLKEYARILGLDQGRVAASYLARRPSGA